MAKQDNYTRYTVRIPTPLYERVKSAAGEASVNSLIVDILAEKYPAPIEDEQATQKMIIQMVRELLEKERPETRDFVEGLLRRIEKPISEEDLAEVRAILMEGVSKKSIFDAVLSPTPPDPDQ